MNWQLFFFCIVLPVLTFIGIIVMVAAGLLGGS